jgi:hypothetical protein
VAAPQEILQRGAGVAEPRMPINDTDGVEQLTLCDLAEPDELRAVVCGSGGAFGVGGDGAEQPMGDVRLERVR